jgi:hypothetical protein
MILAVCVLSMVGCGKRETAFDHNAWTQSQLRQMHASEAKYEPVAVPSPRITIDVPPDPSPHSTWPIVPQRKPIAAQRPQISEEEYRVAVSQIRRDLAETKASMDRTLKKLEEITRLVESRLGKDGAK